MNKKAGAPKGGRVHWLLWHLTREFKGAYELYYKYVVQFPSFMPTKYVTMQGIIKMLKKCIIFLKKKEFLYEKIRRAVKITTRT